MQAPEAGESTFGFPRHVFGFLLSGRWNKSPLREPKGVLIEGELFVIGDKLPNVRLNREVFATFDCQSLEIIII